MRHRQALTAFVACLCPAQRLLPIWASQLVYFPKEVILMEYSDRGRHVSASLAASGAAAAAAFLLLRKKHLQLPLALLAGVTLPPRIIVTSSDAPCMRFWMRWCNFLCLPLLENAIRTALKVVALHRSWVHWHCHLVSIRCRM
jgi:hypothetical protein